MDNYKIGTIFDLYDDDAQKYMVLNNFEKENNTYILASPVEKDKGIWKIRYTETFLLSIDKNTQKLGFETDEEIVRAVFYDLMAKSVISN